MNTTNQIVETLKTNGEDFEWYPTTDEIIKRIADDISANEATHCGSILDIGAGNGKVLGAIQKSENFSALYAIEKSPILCRQMPNEILVIGTDFAQQSLLSKPVDVIFSNPPYSEFETWSEKVIREAAAYVIYLVIPDRWQQCQRITDAIKYRDAEAETLGTFDFENAERAARARVNIVKISLHRGADDAFERFFNEQFAELIAKFAPSKQDPNTAPSNEPTPEDFKPYHALVIGPNYIEALVELYNCEMTTAQRNYQLVTQLDVALLKEFEVDPRKIMSCLRQRLDGLRREYWHELFDHLGAVTDRLTAASRTALLNKLHEHIQVDFTITNILEVLAWVIKNADAYLDTQLVAVYENMVAKCNVKLYKSNTRTWQEERWRYNGEQSKNTHFALDYRIITHRIGGINYRLLIGDELDARAADFLGDLCTLARNLGFIPHEHQRSTLYHNERRNWKRGELYTFHASHNGKIIELFDVRAYQNGNLHLRLNKDFILALNVEHGRLRGWINTPTQAAEELQDANAAKYFATSTRLLGFTDPTKLLAA
jgi:hypothetical protein